jgi:hypothetical protein
MPAAAKKFAENCRVEFPANSEIKTKGAKKMLSPK